MIFSRDSKDDKTLKEVYDKGLIKPYIVLNRDGLKIGIFSLMGKDAAEVAPFADPVTFDDPIASAKKMTDILRNREKVDIVICLSHSGLYKDKSKSEDEILAKEVKGIDVIISGHTHTRLDKAIISGNTIIVSAWAFGKQAGVLDITYNSGKVSMAGYKTVLMDSSIVGDQMISADIRNMEGGINMLLLKYHNTSFNSIVAETKYDLIIDEFETNLGNLVADSLRWSVNTIDYDPEDPSSKVVVAVESRGPIRDDLLVGKTGKIAMSDLFSAFPLGIGFEEKNRSIGYPVVTFYLYASEIKKALEVLTSVHPLKGEDYFLQISGIKCKYNSNRMIFDRVTDMQIGSEEEGYVPLDYSSSNKKLYRVAANIYNATFLKIVGKFTFGFLEIIPKDKKGNPINKLVDCRVDIDKNTPGIQELKEWVGLLDYMRSFPDTNGNGIPDVPEKYKGPLGRIVSEASLNPVNLLSRGNYITWAGFAVFLALASILAFLIRAGIKRGKIIK
jgi:5'-nucleotidase